MNKVKLKDIVDIYNGSTPSTSDIDNFNGDIPWITPKDLSDRKTRFINYGERNITDKGLKSIGGKLLPAGTILFTSRAPIGLMSINTIEASTNQGFKNMVCKPDKVFNIYLYYLLKTKVSKIQELGTGTTFKEVSKSTIENFELNIIEDLPTQQKIAAVLSALDDKIELNNKINAELEAMAKTLYDYWFVQFDFPNEEGKPYKSSGGKMVYNPILKREIPEGWEDCTLGDISNLVRGVSYNKQDIQSEIHEDTIKILRATNITKNIIDLNDPILVSNSFVKEEQVLKPFDILITMSSGSIDHIGKNGFYYFDEKVAFGAFCAKIQMDELFRYYIYSYMQSNVFSSTIKNECLGTNINNLNGSMVKGFKHIKPSKYILERFNSLVEPCFKKIRVNIKQNQELATLRDWLLPMLMNGQVRVE